MKVDGNPATLTRDGGELTITPRHGLDRRHWFTVVVTYDGVPEAINDVLGTSGFIHTDDGALVAGQPRVASTWYPVNDHPLDTASYHFAITVPAGLEANSNGVLGSNRTRRGWTTWEWNAKEPMASYLTTMTVGEFDLRATRAGGVLGCRRPRSLRPGGAPAHRGSDGVVAAGELVVQAIDDVVSVPADDTTLSFWVDRTPSSDGTSSSSRRTPRATTTGRRCPNRTGITAQETCFSCPCWFFDHPFLTHYQTDNGDNTCTPSGYERAWNAVTGTAAATSCGRSISAPTRDPMSSCRSRTPATRRSRPTGSCRRHRCARERPTPASRTTATRSTAGPCRGRRRQPRQRQRLDRRHVRRRPTAAGDQVDASFARQPEILDFLSGYFGRYPFSAAGGIVDDLTGSDSRSRTRPADLLTGLLRRPGRGRLASSSTSSPTSGSATTCRSERGRTSGSTRASPPTPNGCGASTRDSARRRRSSTSYAAVPDDDPFWTLTIGDPGPDHCSTARSTSGAR